MDFSLQLHKFTYSYCSSNCVIAKVITPNAFASKFISILIHGFFCSFYSYSSSNYRNSNSCRYRLYDRERVTTVAVAIFGRAINLWEAILKIPKLLSIDNFKLHSNFPHLISHFKIPIFCCCCRCYLIVFFPRLICHLKK